MKWLDNIQWQRDIGVELKMMNNQAPPNRNTWYWEILQETVAGKTCLEIGFGAGLLSLMAIQAGANRIVAWESNRHRYQLGCHIIKQLGLESKIELHQGLYQATSKPAPDTVIIHEIIGPNIWNEGLRSSVPVGDNLIVPGEYKMTFDIICISEQEYENNFFPNRVFDPQVDVDKNYVSLINNLIQQTPEVIYDRNWYDSKQFKLVDQVEFYTLNVNNIKQIPKSFTAGINLPTSNTDRFILYPKSFIRHNNKEMFWSYYNPLLVPKFARSITVTQNFDSGEFFQNT